MTCQRCGKRDASIHLIELVEGQRKSIWLCPVCAGNEDAGGASLDGPGREADDGESESLASFLSQVFEPAADAIEDVDLLCPDCGYNLKKFASSNRLGCALCYQAFRSQLMPMLAGFHRHVSHLGKVPHRESAAANRPGQITRTRVALEKAIAAEDFEEAAHLRDRIRLLESGEEGV